MGILILINEKAKNIMFLRVVECIKLMILAAQEISKSLTLIEQVWCGSMEKSGYYKHMG